VEATTDTTDVLVALNQETIDKNVGEVPPGGLVLADAAFHPVLPADRTGVHLIELPLTQIAKELGSVLMRNMVAVGASAALMNLPLAPFQDYVARRFGSKGEAVVGPNQAAVQRGYDQIRAEAGHLTQIRLGEPHPGDRVVITGNDALALGAIAGGCRIMAAYPITPASDVMEALIKWMPLVGGVVVQSEDEIAAIHMAVGASYAGSRTFVATSGPGFSLMTEGIGYAATIEVPLVVIDNQRGGPSTGMPTKGEQSDLNHALYAGHGEFARIVLAPTNILDSVAVMQEALNLAEHYQCVVLLLLDLEMAMNQKSYPWSRIESLLTAIPIDRSTTVLDGAVQDYRRFHAVEGHLPQRTIPGVAGGAYVASGDEHDERGWMEPDFSQVRSSLHLRRLHKVDQIDYKRPWDRIGDENAPVVLMGMGAMSELISAAVLSMPDIYQGLLLRQLAPLPTMPKFSSRVEMIIAAEYNATGQLQRLVEPMFPGKEFRSVRRYDGEQFTVEEFTEQLMAIRLPREGMVD
jgi:2-oxoglutarate ferredoxin oxidoreductase subunit alpha